VQAIMSGSFKFAMGVGVALFLLFFFLRDREPMLAAIRGLLPLSQAEASQVFRQVDDTIYAILYGTLAVCVVQGALGALAFWWLGLHAPLLWGSAMAVMAIVPMVGTAIVWGPAALYLLLQGSPDKALLLAAWGFLVIGLIDNVLKPAIVKDRMHVHVVPAFVAILGGLAAFGATGAIIGPVILAVALALIDIARRRAQALPAS
jgi:predicted PurR-regulated permease PerM